MTSPIEIGSTRFDTAVLTNSRLVLIGAKRLHLCDKLLGPLQELLDLLGNRFVAVIGLLSKFGQTIQKSTLLAGDLPIDNDFRAEQGDDSAVGRRVVSVVVENCLCSVEGCVVESVDDCGIREASCLTGLCIRERLVRLLKPSLD